MPAAQSKSKGKRRAKATDTGNADERAQCSDVDLHPLTTQTAATKPKRRRPVPAKGGECHTPPCAACAKKEQPCMKEIGGGACLACVKLKSKCDYSGVKGQRPKKERRRRISYNRVPKKTMEKKAQEKKVPRVKSKTEWMDVDSDEDTGDMTDPESDAPQRPRRITAGSAAVAPARSRVPALSSSPARPTASDLMDECE